MAGATKRTSVMLVVLAVIFIIIAIILCLFLGRVQHRYLERPRTSYIEDEILTDTAAPTTTTTTITTTTDTAAPTTTTTTTTTIPSQPTTSVIPSTPKPPLPPSPSTTTTTTTITTTDAATSSLPPTTITTAPVSTTSTTTDSTELTTTTTQSTQPEATESTTTSVESDATSPSPSQPTTTTSSTSTPLPPLTTTTTTTTASESPSTTPASESTTTPATTTPPPTTTITAGPPPTQPPTTTSTQYSDLTPTTTSDATQPHTTSSPPTSDTTLDSSTTLELSSHPTQPQSTQEHTSTTSEFPTPTTESLKEAESTTSSTTESSADSSYSSITSTATTSTLPSTTPSQTTLCPPPANTETEDVCTTPACKTLAARMLDMMDHTEGRPCEDFYQYACGGVTDNLFLDPESQQKVTNDLILDNLKDMSPEHPLLGPVKVFYDSCTAAVEDIHNKTLWLPYIQDAFSNVSSAFSAKSMAEDSLSTDASPVNFTKILAEMMKIHFAPFFDVLLDVAEDSTNKFVLMLTPQVQPSPFSKGVAGVTCNSDHINHTEYALQSSSASYDVNVEYEKYSECIGRGRGLHARLQQMSLAVKELDLTHHFNYTTHNQGVEGLLVDNLMDTEFLLGDLHDMLPRKPDLRENHLKKNFRNVTLSYLEQKFNFHTFKVEWQTLVEELLGHPVDPDNVAVHIYFEDQLNAIFEELDYQQPDQLQRILLLLLAERFYTDLVEPAEHDLGKPEYCLRVTTKLLGDFVSFLYLDNLPHLQERQQKMEDMIKANMAAAKAELMNGSSVAQDAKEMWLNKLSGMKGQVPNPEDLSLYLEQSMNETFLTDNFVENCLTLLRRYRTLMYQQYQASPSRPQVLWNDFLRPFGSSGVSLYASNMFLIPYPAMEAPFFFRDVPDYINYAGIGQMIAHELMHGFDNTGTQYNGKQRQTLEGSSYFQNMSKCLSNQYREPQSQTAASGLTANFKLGTLPLNEVLADSGAVRLAWDAYEHSVSRRQSQGAPTAHAIHGQQLPWLDLKPQQLYFLRIAQTHCSATSNIHMLSLMEDEHLPPRLRVNLMLGNEPRFTEAFNCTPARPQCPYILG